MKPRKIQLLTILLTKAIADARAIDPVTACELFKKEGCAHVDGSECDMATCSMRLAYEANQVL